MVYLHVLLRIKTFHCVHDWHFWRLINAFPVTPNSEYNVINNTSCYAMPCFRHGIDEEPVVCLWVVTFYRVQYPVKWNYEGYNIRGLKGFSCLGVRERVPGSEHPRSWRQYGDSEEFVRTKLTKLVLLIKHQIIYRIYLPKIICFFMIYIVISLY